MHNASCRYAIGQYVDQSGDVISHLNISSAGAEDGGLYACVAANTLATVEHKARLNIYGNLKWEYMSNYLRKFRYAKVSID